MSVRAFFNSLREGFTGILRHPIVTLASVTTILLMLLLMAGFVIFSADARHIMRAIGQEPPIEVYMRLSSTDVERQAVTDYLVSDTAHIRTYEMLSPEQNYNDFRKNLGGSSSILDDFDYNQYLPYTFRIQLTDPTYSGDVSMKLQAFPGVSKVMLEQQVMVFLTSATKWVNIATGAAFLVLFLIALFIISNMVRISVYSRAAEINIMKYVGATNTYIRLPFIVEGAVVGLFSAICAWGIAYFVYDRIYSAAMAKIEPGSLYSLLPMSGLSKIVLLVCAFSGILIGAFGSGVAVRKYIRV